MPKPNVTLVAHAPRKEGSNSIVASFEITSHANYALIWHLRITRHKRLWPDVTVASEDDQDVLEPGQTIRRTIEGRCEKSGSNKYFAKVTAQVKAFSEPAEDKSNVVDLSCP
jgi:hypothetical protein